MSGNDPAAPAEPAGTSLEDYAQQSFLLFLQSWQVEAPLADGGSQAGSQQAGMELYYANMVRLMKAGGDATTDRTLHLDWQHLVAYNRQIADMIQGAYYRLEPALRRAVQSFVREVEPEFSQVGRPWGPSMACCWAVHECKACGLRGGGCGGEGGGAVHACGARAQARERARTAAFACAPPPCLPAPAGGGRQREGVLPVHLQPGRVRQAARPQVRGCVHTARPAAQGHWRRTS